MPDPRRVLEEDARMIMPPEPEDAQLIACMQAGLAQVSANIVPLLRYQSATGSQQDHEFAQSWMQANGMPFDPAHFAVVPGANAAIEVVLRVTCTPDTAVLCESITYLGIRAIAARVKLKFVGLQEDTLGILPAALEDAIKTHKDVIFYLNPTLRNPTTHHPCSASKGDRACSRQSWHPFG